MSLFIRKLRWLLERRRREAELEEELQFYIDEETEERRARGVDARQARRDAGRELGNATLVKESVRAVWIWTFLEQIVQDGRYALRVLKNSPVFALTAILSLAIGLGMSLAIYTVADNLLLRPLPYAHSSQLVMVWERHARPQVLHANVAPRNYFAWKARNGAFQTMAAFDIGHAVLDDNERAEEVTDLEAEADLLPMLGVQPIVGRRFTEAESRGTSEPVMLISFRIWQSWFGGDRNIAGKRVLFGGRPRAIVGVLPPNFYFEDRGIDVWYPLDISPAENNGDGRWLRCIARLKPAVGLRQAESEMTGIARQRVIEDPAFNTGWTITLEPLRNYLVREVKTSLLVLLGAVGLLLAVACANVANLLLARYTARQREIALRGSLGAGRLRVVRQLLTESILLTLIGGALGVLLARSAVIVLVSLAPKDLTRSIEIVTDTRIYLCAVCLAALASIVFGLAPAFVGSRSALAQTMQSDSRASIGTKSYARAWLVGVEIALSVILLSGAVLLFRSLERLQRVNPGIDAANLLTLRVSLPGAHYTKASQTVQFFSRAVQRIEELPGVRAASAVSHLPFNGMAPGTDVFIGGRPIPKPGEGIGATIRTVLPGYFHTMGIPLLSGRDFTPADNVEETPHRFIVSQEFVRRYLGSSNPLDQQIKVWMEEKNPFGRIIGVVGDVRDQTLDEAPNPTVYYPHAHLAYTRMVIVVRSAGNALAEADPIRRVIRSIDPAQPIADVRTMREVIADTFSRQSFTALLLAGFSAAALLLAAIGIYGILTYSVSERTREIGVRVALGATPDRIVSLVVHAAARPVIGGLLIGVSGALALSGVLRSMLFEVSPRDPLSFVLVPAILAIVGFVAAYVPAHRAAHLDPMTALRVD